MPRGPRRPRFWTCQRQQNGQRCLARNPRVKQKCIVCGGPRPAPRTPKHMVALESSYEYYVELNGGERCAICLRPPGTRRLDRDHDHRHGRPRGLLCARCNRALPSWVTSSWLRSAADYLDRAERLWAAA